MGMLYELDDIEKRALVMEIKPESSELDKLRQFVSTIARMTKDGECASCGYAKRHPLCEDHRPLEASAVDSFRTVESLIDKARTLTRPRIPEVRS